MIKGEQIRAARGLLGWSMADLAEASGVSASTIKRIESLGAVATGTVGTIESLEQAFQNVGVIFIGENGGGAGVRYAKPSKEREK
jgi:transcriptional regulator with XRE-family HTH domain